MGLEKCTPETKRDKIQIRAGKRAMQYEERIRNARDMNILKEYASKRTRERQSKQRTFERDENTL